MSATHERVQEIARDVFDDEELVLEDSTTAADVPGWDSLAHVNLMYSIEEEFGIRFSEEEFGGFTDVGALLRTIDAKAGA